MENQKKWLAQRKLEECDGEDCPGTGEGDDFTIGVGPDQLSSRDEEEESKEEKEEEEETPLLEKLVI